MLWCAMVMPPMANSSLAAVPADGKAVRIPLPMPIHRLAARRFCMPLKNAAVCAVSRARIAGFAYHRVPVDQKKGAQLPPLCATLLAPDPEDLTSTILELDELRSFVLEKAHNSWIWIALCRKSRQVVACDRGSEQTDVSATVGSHCRGVSAGALRNVFLSNLRGGDPGAAHSRG